MFQIRSILCISGLLFATASAIPALGAQHDPSPPAGHTSADLQSPGPQTAPGKAQISVSQGRISANFKNLPLGSLGDELSHKAGIAVVFEGGAASQKVSAAFQKLPMDEGLRRILSDQDVFYFYSSDGKNPSALRAVWVYPKGKGRGMAPVPPETWESTRDLSARLADKDPQARGRAIEALVERKGAAAKGALLKAMQDGSAQVRATALYAAIKSAVDLPQEDLANLTLHDDSPDVRFLALQSLNGSNSPDLRSIAEQAAKDPSEAVRSTAQEIISRLGGQTASQSLSGHQQGTQGENQPPPSP